MITESEVNEVIDQAFAQSSVWDAERRKEVLEFCRSNDLTANALRAIAHRYGLDFDTVVTEENYAGVFDSRRDYILERILPNSTSCVHVSAPDNHIHITEDDAEEILREYVHTEVIHVEADGNYLFVVNDEEIVNESYYSDMGASHAFLGDVPYEVYEELKKEYNRDDARRIVLFGYCGNYLCAAEQYLPTLYKVKGFLGPWHWWHNYIRWSDVLDFHVANNTMRVYSAESYQGGVREYVFNPRVIELHILPENLR